MVPAPWSYPLRAPVPPLLLQLLLPLVLSSLTFSFTSVAMAAFTTTLNHSTSLSINPLFFSIVGMLAVCSSYVILYFFMTLKLSGSYMGLSVISCTVDNFLVLPCSSYFDSSYTLYDVLCRGNSRHAVWWVLLRWKFSPRRPASKSKKNARDWHVKACILF